MLKTMINCVCLMAQCMYVVQNGLLCITVSVAEYRAAVISRDSGDSFNQLIVGLKSFFLSSCSDCRTDPVPAALEVMTASSIRTFPVVLSIQTGRSSISSHRVSVLWSAGTKFANKQQRNPVYS